MQYRGIKNATDEAGVDDKDVKHGWLKTKQASLFFKNPNFTLEELTHSEVAERKNLDNTPNASEVANLTRLAALLEQVRTLLGKPILINSGFRSKPVNDSVGSKDTSQHRLGCAADLRVPGMTPKQVVEACLGVSCFT